MHTQNKLCKKCVAENLKTKTLGRDLYVFDCVTSTFDASDTITPSHGTVVCAKKQTAGKGRLGRSWESDGSGLYFSLILKPSTPPEAVQIYTIICALGVQRAIAKKIPCSIKWPNDIVSAEGKKLCGILSKIKFADSKCEYINVGVGINTNNTWFSSELKYATSLRLCSGVEIDENELLCAVLYETEHLLAEKSIAKITDDFSKVCVTVGSRVKAIYSSGEKIVGTGKKIEPDGSLTIQKDDASLINVNSGEVSVRGIYGEKYV